jgi:TonB family protein
MKSSLIISIVLHGLLFWSLLLGWSSNRSLQPLGFVYSVKIMETPGGGGSPGGGRRNNMRVGIVRGEHTGVRDLAKADTPAKTEETAAVPKKKPSAPKPEASPTYNLGQPEGELSPLEGGGGGGGGTGGGGFGPGGGGGRGGGYGSGVTNVQPKPLYIPWPKYPARVKEIPYGSVELDLLVNEHGDVRDVKVSRGLPYAQLDSIAVQAARQIRFTPGLTNGVRAPMWVRLTIGFQPR